MYFDVCTLMCVLVGVCGCTGLPRGGGATPEGSLRPLPWSARPQQALTGNPNYRRVHPPGLTLITNIITIDHVL